MSQPLPASNAPRLAASLNLAGVVVVCFLAALSMPGMPAASHASHALSSKRVSAIDAYAGNPSAELSPLTAVNHRIVPGTGAASAETDSALSASDMDTDAVRPSTTGMAAAEPDDEPPPAATRPEPHRQKHHRHHVWFLGFRL